VVQLDASDAASLDTAVTAVVEAAGRLDVPVNNGDRVVGMAEGYDMEQVQQIVESNFLTAVRANRPSCRRCAAGVGTARAGVVGVGRFVMPYMTLYSPPSTRGRPWPRATARARAPRHRLGDRGAGSFPTSGR
jgi:hypothetical protein